MYGMVTNVLCALYNRLGPDASLDIWIVTILLKCTKTASAIITVHCENLKPENWNVDMNYFIEINITTSFKQGKTVHLQIAI